MHFHPSDLGKVITKSCVDSIDIWIYKLLLTYLLLVGSGNILKHLNVDRMVVEI